MRFAWPGVKVVNETSFQDRHVAAVVTRVARDLEVSDDSLLVRVKHHGRPDHAYRGRFYVGGPGSLYSEREGRYVPAEMFGKAHLVTLRVAKPDIYPVLNHVYDHRDVPDPWVCETWREALASVAGHELMHARQHRLGRPFRENECEWAGYRAWTRERARRATLGVNRKATPGGDAA